MTGGFKVARNPDPGSRLPYLVWLPIEGGIVLKAREPWPRAARVDCSHEGTPRDEGAGLVDEAPVVLCRRRGAAIDLVLDRPQLARSQFVFTTAWGRPAVWWQTQKTVQSANPGARVPRGRAAGPLSVVVDTREKYGWKFANRLVHDGAQGTSGRRLRRPGGRSGGCGCRAQVSGQSRHFARLPNATHGRIRMGRDVVEADYPDLFRTQRGRGSWLADMLGRLAVRYPEVPIIFAGSREFAEEWAYRFLGAAASDSVPRCRAVIPSMTDYGDRTIETRQP